MAYTYKYKYKPSRIKAREYAEKMQDIDLFCKKNFISRSTSGDSYYFNLNGVHYRVSNHTIEASNRAALDEITREQKRELYHDKERDENTVYITASKLRIIEIYNDLLSGYKLEGRGYRK